MIYHSDDQIEVFEQLANSVRDRINDAGLDPTVDTAEIEVVIKEVIDDHQKDAYRTGAEVFADVEAIATSLLESVTDLGPYGPLLANDNVITIFTEGGDIRWRDDEGRMRSCDANTTAEMNHAYLLNMLRESGRSVDPNKPVVVARVHDNKVRIAAAMDKAVPDNGISATIRKYRLSGHTLSDMVGLGSASIAAAGLLHLSRQAGLSVVMSGKSGVGKTTWIEALAAASPATDVIRVGEKHREILLSIPNVIAYFEEVPPAADGSGGWPLSEIVEFMLTAETDLIIVGEVRGVESYVLGDAANSGSAMITSVHADSAKLALTALINKALKMPGIAANAPAMRASYSECIDFVVQLDKIKLGRGRARRQIAEIHAVETITPDDAREFQTTPIFVRPDRNGPLEYTGNYLPSGDDLSECLADGVNIYDVLRGDYNALPDAGGADQ